MNKTHYERMPKSGIALAAILFMVILANPAKAALQQSFTIGRDVISKDGNSATGEYLQMQYSYKDVANGLNGTPGAPYNAIVLTAVNDVNDATPSVFYGAQNGNAFAIGLPGSSWLGEGAGSIKIDADRISVAGKSTGVFRVEMKSWAAFPSADYGTLSTSFPAFNPTSPNVNLQTYWMTPLRAEFTQKKYIVVFPKFGIQTFDIDGKLANGNLVSPIVIKQDGSTAAGGDRISVVRSLSGAASSSLVFGTKSFDLSGPSTVTTTEIDADNLPAGKTSARLRAYLTLGGKTKDVFAPTTFPVTVLAQPLLPKFAVTDNGGAKDEIKPSNCLVTTSNISGDDKIVFKYDAKNLTKMVINLVSPAKTYTFSVPSPSGIGKLAAIDSDCLAIGNYTMSVDYENTSAYKGATKTNVSTVSIQQ